MLGSDQKRFNKIYNDYHSMVRNVLYNMTGKDSLEDLTQETFIRVWSGLPRFAFKSSIQTWIYRITLNTALDHLRRKKHVHGLSSQMIEESEIEINHSLSYTELIEMALKELDEDSQSVVVLYYFEELSIKNIATILKIPEGTVKSRMHQSKKKMKTFFAAKGVSL